MKIFLKRFIIVFISLSLACVLIWSYASSYIKNIVIESIIKELNKSDFGKFEYETIRNEFSLSGFKFKIISPSLRVNSSNQNILIKSPEITIVSDWLIKDIDIKSGKRFDLYQDKELKTINYNKDPDLKINLRVPLIISVFRNQYYPEYEQITYNSSGFVFSKNDNNEITSIANVKSENILIKFDDKYIISNINIALRSLVEPSQSLGEIKFSSSLKTSRNEIDIPNGIHADENIIEQMSLNNDLFDISFLGKSSKSNYEFKVNITSYNKMLFWFSKFLTKWQSDFINEKIVHNSNQLNNSSIEIILKNGLIGKQTYQDLMMEYFALVKSKLKEKTVQ